MRAGLLLVLAVCFFVALASAEERPGVKSRDVFKRRVKNQARAKISKLKSLTKHAKHVAGLKVAHKQATMAFKSKARTDPEPEKGPEKEPEKVAEEPTTEASPAALAAEEPESVEPKKEPEPENNENAASNSEDEASPSGNSNATPIKAQTAGASLAQSTTATTAKAKTIAETSEAYGAGLADQSQSTATIDNEMTKRLAQISQTISDETVRATKALNQKKTEFTESLEQNKQDRQKAESDLQTAINKEIDDRKQADDDRNKSENDVAQSLNDQLSKLNDKVSQCSQSVQKAVQKANMLEGIVNAYADKKGGGTKIAFIEEAVNAHLAEFRALHKLHTQYEMMAVRKGW